MDKKTIISAILGAIITGIVMIALASFAGVFQAGSDALTEAQIKVVLKETLVTTINGETKTFSEALSLINERQIKMEQALIALTED